MFSSSGCFFLSREAFKQYAQIIPALEFSVLYTREAQGMKKASNSRYTLLPVVRSYQHKAVGELHRQKIVLYFSVTSIVTFFAKVQVHYLIAMNEERCRTCMMCGFGFGWWSNG